MKEDALQNALIKVAARKAVYDAFVRGLSAPMEKQAGAVITDPQGKVIKRIAKGQTTQGPPKPPAPSQWNTPRQGDDFNLVGRGWQNLKRGAGAVLSPSSWKSGRTGGAVKGVFGDFKRGASHTGSMAKTVAQAATGTHPVQKQVRALQKTNPAKAQSAFRDARMAPGQTFLSKALGDTYSPFRDSALTRGAGWAKRNPWTAADYAATAAMVTPVGAAVSGGAKGATLAAKGARAAWLGRGALNASNVTQKLRSARHFRQAKSALSGGMPWNRHWSGMMLQTPKWAAGVGRNLPKSLKAAKGTASLAGQVTGAVPFMKNVASPWAKLTNTRRAMRGVGVGLGATQVGDFAYNAARGTLNKMTPAQNTANTVAAIPGAYANYVHPYTPAGMAQSAISKAYNKYKGKPATKAVAKKKPTPQPVARNPQAEQAALQRYADRYYPSQTAPFYPPQGYDEFGQLKKGVN